MTNSEQAIREKAINIFADIFTAGGEAHEVGGQSFDQLQQSGYIDRKLSDLTALISEHYYPKEFTVWLGFMSSQIKYREIDDKWLWVSVDAHTMNDVWTEYTLDELFNYWEENVR